MNLIAKTDESPVSAELGRYPVRGWVVWTTIPLLLVNSWMVSEIASGRIDGLVLIAIQLFRYFLAMYLYFGTAMLAHQGRTLALGIGAVGCIAVALLFSGGDVLMSLADSAAIILAGVVCGYLAAKGTRRIASYAAGLGTALILLTVVLYPAWVLIAGSYDRIVDDMVKWAMPGTEESVKVMARFLVSVFPAVTMLSASVQFSIGYLLFAAVAGRYDDRVNPAPFHLWKMPRWVAVAFIVAALTRVLADGSAVTVADNVLLYLAVFYSLTGLSLMEFFLRKLRFSLFLKIAFYLMVLISQIIGFIVSLALGLLDSIADWRKIEQSLSLAEN